MKAKKPVVKSEPRKVVKSEPIKKEPKIIIVEPLKVETIRSKEKREYTLNPMVQVTKVVLPEGHVRCIVLREYQGMLEYHDVGDIVDLPERRFKSESFRGLVKEYHGEGQPNKRR